MSEISEFEYFPPPGFMCEECKHSHDTLQKSIAVRLNALREQFASMAAVFRKQREWSDAMRCVYCGAEVDVGN